MTTHEQPTMTESSDESAIPVSEAAAPVNDEDTPVAPETPPTADAVATSTEPAAARPDAEHESSAVEALFAGDDLADLRSRWAGVQAAFVDDPKDCVQKADALVSDLVEQLTTGFAQARSHLEEQWSRGEEASTEDLRLALMHYREFFERLLAV